MSYEGIGVWRKGPSSMTGRRLNAIFGTLLSGAIVTSLLQTALTTALPAIMADFSLTADRAQWLTSAFSLTMAIMVPATAYLIKRFPTRVVFISAMSLFALGILLDLVAWNFPILLGGRVLQALGSAMILPLLQVVVMTAYPPDRQGLVMGIYGLAAGAAPVIAPTLTGLLVDAHGWRSVFLITLVLSLLVLVPSLVLVGNIGQTISLDFDPVSMVLCALTMTGLLWGLGQMTVSPWPNMVVPLAVGLVAGPVFVSRQLKSSHPFLDLRALGNREFRVALVVSILLYLVMMGGSAIYPLLIQETMGDTAMVSGLVMMPGSLAMALMSPLAGRIYDRHGIRGLAIPGSLLLLASCLGTAAVNDPDQLWLLALCYLIRLLGVGCIMTPIVTWGMRTMTPAQVTDGSALLTSLRTLGGAFGSAGFMEVQTLAEGYRGVGMAFMAMAALALVQLILVVVAMAEHGSGPRQGRG